MKIFEKGAHNLHLKYHEEFNTLAMKFLTEDWNTFQVRYFLYKGKLKWVNFITFIHIQFYKYYKYFIYKCKYFIYKYKYLIYSILYIYIYTYAHIIDRFLRIHSIISVSIKNVKKYFERMLYDISLWWQLFDFATNFECSMKILFIFVNGNCNFFIAYSYNQNWNVSKTLLICFLMDK